MKRCLQGVLFVMVVGLGFVLPTTNTFAYYEYDSQFGSLGSGDGQFTYPSTITRDLLGNFYIVDTNNNRIQIFNSSGIYQSQFGSAGTGDGQLSTPYDIATSSVTGNIYITDQGNNRIVEYSSLGVFVRTWGWGVSDGSVEFQICTSNCQAGISGGGNGQFDSPWGIAIDSSGNVYVADYNNSRVQKFATNGSYIGQFGEGLFVGDVADIAIDSSGYVYVADYAEGNRIVKLNPDTTFNRTWGWGVSDGSAEFQICTSGCEAGVSGNGNGQLDAPTSIGISSDGYVFIGEDNNSRIQVFDTSGNYINKFGSNGTGDGQFNYVYGIYTDNSGIVYVADTGNNRIQSFVYFPPMQITTCEGLQDINDNLNADYVLSGNIDCSDTVNWNSGEGFVPVGTNLTPFTGTLDGAGYTISNLTINRPAENYVGLFGYATGITIQDLTITGSVEGLGSVGALAGGIDGGSILIDNVHIDADVTGHGNSIGGIVGDASCISISITDSSMIGDIVVDGSDNVQSVGGLFGYIYANDMTIDSSFNTGNITVVAESYVYYGVGGLVGYNDDVLDITSSYNTGDISVTAGTYVNYGVGGLIGYFYYGGNIDKSYSISDITIDAGSYVRHVGGLWGFNDDDSTVTNSFAQGNINVTAGTFIESVGGLYGDNDGYTVTANNSYSSTDLNLDAAESISYIGGFGGGNYSVDDVTNSFSSGIITMNSDIDDVSVTGGFNAQSFNSTTNNFFDKTASGQDTCTGDGDVSGCTAIENNSSYFLGNSTSEPMASWDFDTVWSVVVGNYPTLKNLPSPFTRVSTGNFTLITKVSAVLGGTLNEVVGAPNAYRVGFEWGQDMQYGNTTIQVGDYSATTFSTTITTLTCNTTYHYRAYAISSGSTEYGRDKSFTTDSCSDFVVPTFDWNTPPDGGQSAYGTFISPKGILYDSEENIYVLDTENNRVQKFTSTGIYITSWGSSGSGNGQFSSAANLAIDLLDNIYVADYGNNRIQKFNSSGVYVSQFGTSGTGDGELSGPVGVAFDPSDNIYVSDTGNDRVQKFNSEGEYISQFGGAGSGDGEFNGPRAITIDSSGNIYVADVGNYRIQKFNSAGVYQSQFGTLGSGDGEFSNPVSVKTDSSGNIYVSDLSNNRIQRFNSAGVYQSQFGTSGSGDGEFSGPWGIDIDLLGNILVVDTNNNRIQKFDSSGIFISKFGNNVDGNGNGQGDGGLASINGITTDAEGYIYVTDENNYRVQKFNSEGVYITGFGDGSTPSESYGIAVNSEGYIYVADYANGAVYKFNSDGTLDSELDATDGGGFAGPLGIAIDSNGNIYVSDYSNSNIQKFNSSDEWVASWDGSLGEVGSFSNPYYVDVDSEDNLYVVDYGNAVVQKFDSNGNFLLSFDGTSGDGTQFSEPEGIAVDSNDNIYISDVDLQNIQVFNTSGSFLGVIGEAGNEDGQFNLNESDIVVDSVGNLYVADYGNSRIQKFSPSSEPLTITPHSASEVEKTTATLNGTISDTGGDDITSRGFIYSTTNLFYNNRITNNGNFSTGIFSESISGLTCNTTYHYRPFAISSVDTIYGTDATFNTLSCGGSSGGSGGGGSGSRARVVPAPIATSTSTTTKQTPKLLLNLKLGDSNPEVTTLQTILVSLGFLKVSPTGYFGPLTESALKAYQVSKGIPPVGVVGPLTRASLNSLTLNSPTITPPTNPLLPATTTPSTYTRNLDIGDTGDDVRSLQSFLTSKGYSVPITGYFGPLTQSALASFQKDNGISPAVGYFGPVTRGKVR